MFILKLQIFLMSQISNSKIIWFSSLFNLLLFVSCVKKQTGEFSNIKITLAKDSQTIILKGLRPEILKQLKEDSLSLEGWQTLMGVYKIPRDSGLLELQKEQPGKYRIHEQQIIFKPDTAFESNNVYLCRFYGRNLKIDPLRVLIDRKLPHVITFPESIFHIK